MLKNYFSIAILLICFNQSIAQKKPFNEAEFINKVRNLYFHLDNENKDVVTSELTSTNFTSYLSTVTNKTSKNPLKVDWSNSKSITIKKTAFNVETESFSTAREQLILVARNFLVNWSEFFVKKQIPDSAMNYNFTENENDVFFSYVFNRGKEFHRVSKQFDKNGLLIRVNIQLQSKESIYMVPKYQPLGDKKLLYGWLFQKKDKNGNIVEGNEVEIKYKLIKDIFYPEDVLIKVQIITEKNKVYAEQLKFTNYKLNDEEI